MDYSAILHYLAILIPSVDIPRLVPIFNGYNTLKKNVKEQLQSTKSSEWFNGLMKAWIRFLVVLLEVFAEIPKSSTTYFSSTSSSIQPLGQLSTDNMSESVSGFLPSLVTMENQATRMPSSYSINSTNSYVSVDNLIEKRESISNNGKEDKNNENSNFNKLSKNQNQPSSNNLKISQSSLKSNVNENKIKNENNNEKKKKNSKINLNYDNPYEAKLLNTSNDSLALESCDSTITLQNSEINNDYSSDQNEKKPDLDDYSLIQICQDMIKEALNEIVFALDRINNDILKLGMI